MPSDEPMPSDESVERVLVMFKCHLDVGFTDTESRVLQQYADLHLPRAIDVADRMRAESDDRYVWTVPAWLLHRYLDRADAAARARADEAISRGDLAWHALPFTAYTELLDRSSLVGSLGFSARLDARYGVRTTAARLTDVPGHTRGLVGVLADGGVTFLDIGVNPGCRAPRVPALDGIGLPESEDDQPDPDLIAWHDAEPVHADQGTPEAERLRLTIEGINSPRTHLFRWRDPEGAEVTVLYHPRSYGSTVRLPVVPVALSMRVHGDNLGPHSLESVRHAYLSLRRKFPRASVTAASLSQIAATVATVTPDLPVLTKEIGDTWMYGTGSDPAKTGSLREVLRLRSEWVDSGRLEAGGTEDIHLLGELIPAPEHNWGLSTSVYLRSRTGYRTEELARARLQEPMYVANDEEWSLKRGRPMAALGVLRDELRDEATAALEALHEPVPAQARARAGGPGGPEDRQLGNRVVRATVSATTGALVDLVDLRTGRQWARPEGVATFTYQGFDHDDYRRFASRYNHAAFTANDFGKPGLADYPARSLLWHPSAALLTQQDDGALLAELTPPPDADDPERLTAWPRRVVARYAVGGPGEASIDVTVWVAGKPANRRPEAMWLSFGVDAPAPHGWRLDKLGQALDPHDVVDDGGRYLHGVGRGAQYRDEDGGLDLLTPDAHLVSPGGRGLLRFDNDPLDLSGGMHVNLYNNLWGTAFPQWYDLDMRFRFRLTLHAAEEAAR